MPEVINTIVLYVSGFIVIFLGIPIFLIHVLDHFTKSPERKASEERGYKRACERLERKRREKKAMKPILDAKRKEKRKKIIENVLGFFLAYSLFSRN